jgi:hypothetical protein
LYFRFLGTVPRVELIGGLTLIGALIYGLIIGAISLLVLGSLGHIASVETISWKWNQFWKRGIPASIFGLMLGLISGLLKSGRLRGLIGGLIFGLISGLIGGFTNAIKRDKASPDQGIKLSLKHSMAAFLVAGLTVWATGMALAQLTGRGEGLIYSLNIGLSAGLIVGLNRGGSTVIKHYALRLILWLKGYTPFHFIKFLDHCAKLILLKKVGGGYIFIHRMLLDYFADLPPIEKSGKSKRT